MYIYAVIIIHNGRSSEIDNLNPQFSGYFCSTRDVTLSYPLHVTVGSPAGRQVAIHVKSHPSWPLIGRARCR